MDEWKDRVSYQRLREDDLRQSGESRIDDQGVRFVGHQPVGHEQHHFTAMANDEPDPGGSGEEDDDGNDDRGQRDPRRPVPRREGNRNNPSSPPRRRGVGGGGGGGGGDGGGNGGGDNGSDGEPNGNRRPSRPPNRNSRMPRGYTMPPANPIRYSTPGVHECKGLVLYREPSTTPSHTNRV